METNLKDIDPEQYVVGSIDVDVRALPDGRWLVYGGADGVELFAQVEGGEVKDWSAMRSLETITFPPRKDSSAAPLNCQGRGYVCAALGDGRYVCFCA